MERPCKMQCDICRHTWTEPDGYIVNNRCPKCSTKEVEEFDEDAPKPIWEP